MRIAATGWCVLLMTAAVMFAPRSPTVAPQVEPQWIRVIFGIDRKQATWDGELEVLAGEVTDLADWGFEARDQLDREQRSWTALTAIPKIRPTFAEPFRGIDVKVKDPSSTFLRFRTEQGTFEVATKDLLAGRPSSLLEGRVRVELAGTEELVHRSETDDDFASLAIDERGHRHVLWLACDGPAQSEQLLWRDLDEPGSRPQPVVRGSEFSSPRLFARPGNVLEAVWCSPGDHANWDIYAARCTLPGPNSSGKSDQNSTLTWKAERLTTAEGTDFELSAAVGPDGVLWLAWQSFRDGQAEIYARCRREGKWSPDLRITRHVASDWQPAVAVDDTGRAWIGFDSYRSGNYDVYLTDIAWDGTTADRGELRPVATSPDFEAHASVLADDGKIWIAWNAGGPGWGKDFRNGETRFRGSYAEPLHTTRRLELRCLVDGQLMQPSSPLPLAPPPDRIPLIERAAGLGPTRYHEYPHLARDGDGRMWVFFRMCRQGWCAHPPRGLHWECYATTFTGLGWLDPVPVPMSRGRQDQRISIAAAADGPPVCAWSEGDRFASVDRKYSVRCGQLPPVREPAREIPLEIIETEQPVIPPPAARPAPQLVRGAETYQLYFGDMHRHTNISRCMPTLDGSLSDAQRYAIDAVEYDFLAITDHTRDVDPFAWWRTQKAADQHLIPGRYVPIYAYERSNKNPGGGHRNVFFLNRGAEVSRSDHWYDGRGLPAEDARPDTTLYPWMRERGDAITAAHTPVWAAGAGRGTWSYNDPALEPVAEVFQALRRSYERPDSGVAEEASLWYALKQGHKLGFIASSDHLSTHQSFACVWAKEKTREALFDAIRKRRTYAATDHILLDFRIGEAVLGEEVDHPADQPVILSLEAEGTASISEVQIVRSGKVIHTTRPGTRKVILNYTDPAPADGESWYYIRLQQDNGDMAWASPIWIHR
ncbi:MAG: CehA/McbA family metallohydrolase [Planctomycetaceae bacterium]|nr:CehA/McbA family metallohydrolase [Planctomycetaceae bacterium]